MVVTPVWGMNEMRGGDVCSGELGETDRVNWKDVVHSTK